MRGRAGFGLEGVAGDPACAGDILRQILRVGLFHAPRGIPVANPEAVIAVHAVAVGLLGVLNAEVIGNQTFVEELVHPAQRFLRAGQHVVELEVRHPVFFGNLAVIKEGIHLVNPAVEGVSRVQVGGIRNGVVTAQLLLLRRLQVGIQLFHVRGNFHAQLFQPILADEHALRRDDDAARGQEILLFAVAHVVLTVLQHFVAEECRQFLTVFRQQVIQRHDAAHVDVLLHQIRAVSHADIRRGAARQTGGEDCAFLPAGNGNPVDLDVVRIAEVLLNVTQLPAVLHVEACDGAVIHFDIERYPIVIRRQCRQRKRRQQQAQRANQSQKLFHVG